MVQYHPPSKRWFLVASSLSVDSRDLGRNALRGNWTWVQLEMRFWGKADIEGPQHLSAMGRSRNRCDHAGPDLVDQFRRAASYVDRILKGEKPIDLPVQAPTKYELVVNLKAGKALGLTVPASFLATADEVVE